MITMIKSSILTLGLFLSSGAYASFSYEGYLSNLAGDPLSSQLVTIQLRIHSPSVPVCLLYDESHILTTGTDGYFSLNVGSGTPITSTGLTFANIFQNSTLMTTSAPCNYTPVALDRRDLEIRVSSDAGATYDTLGTLAIQQAPMAMSAQTISGVAATSLVRASSGTAPSLSPGQITELSSLIAGSSTQYASSASVGTGANNILQLNGTGQIPAIDGSLLANVNAVRLQGRDVQNATPTNGQVLSWSTTNTRWEPTTPSAGGSGTVTSVDLALPGALFSVTSSPITTAGTLTATLATQSQNMVFAGPATGTAVPTFRALAATDIPGLDASQITAGVLAQARGGSKWDVSGSYINFSGSGSVGVGNAAPQARLDVAGSIRIGDDPTTCGSPNAGAIRYSSSQMQYCDGASWINLSAGGGGVASLNGLTGAVTFGNGIAGTAPSFSAAGAIVTLDIPMASATSVTAGLLNKTDYDSFSSGSVAANGASNMNNVNQIVRRDGSGNFDAGQVSVASLRVRNMSNSVVLQHTNASDYTLTLPGDDGTPGQVLSTDGAGVLSWTASGAGAPFPVGSETNPSVSFTGDLGTGMFRPGTYNLGFSTNGTERLRITAAGNVGVGTNIPTAKLEVVGGAIQASARGISAGDGGELRVGELTANGANYVALRSPDVLTGDVILTLPNVYGAAGNILSTDAVGNLSWVAMPGAGAFVEGGNTFGGPAVLGTNNNWPLNIETNGLNRMTIEPTGEVGIGTITPMTPLHLFGLTNSQGLLTLQDDSGNLASAANFRNFINASDYTGATAWSLGDSDSGAHKLSLKASNASYSIALATGATDRLTITPSGSVGIGTITPNGQLAVLSTSGSNTLSLTSVWNNGGSDYNGILLNVTNTASGIFSNLLDMRVGGSSRFTVTRDGYIWAPNGTPSEPAIAGRIQIDSGIFFPDFGVVAVSTGAIERMRVNANGNVGIGTTTPNARLSVNGHIGAMGASPTIGACGTGANAAGNDVRGVANIGSGSISSCELTFNQAYGTPPICTVSWVGAAAPVGLGVTTTTSTMTIYFATPVGGGTSVNYICLQ